MEEENLIKQLLPWLWKSDTGQTRIVRMSCVLDFKSARLHCAAITRRRPIKNTLKIGKVANKSRDAVRKNTIAAKLEDCLLALK